VTYTEPTTTAPRIPTPSYGASAIEAVGYPGVLGSGGNTKPMPMASISKIITTLVVLQKKPLSPGSSGPNIPFTAADASYLAQYAAEDGDVYPIRVGGTLTERQVITIALVPSANNYARALADWAYGSEAKFVPVARAWLKAHGMTSTTMVEPTGINPENASTPHDLMILAKLAIADPTISHITSLEGTTLPVVGGISNTNKLLGIDGIDGIKTGTLNSAGASLLFTSRFDVGGKTITLVGVVLDGPSHPIIDAQIRLMVTAAMAGFHVVQLVTKGQSFGNYKTLWGTTASALASKSASVVVLGGTKITENTSISRVVLGTKGHATGTATFTMTGQTVTVPLVLSRTISDPGGGWRLTHPEQLL
jgi:D-alanyl-D-alanine carboxypeptidase (penicillin-binding protein 5/6)